jgi:hypothetical protein
MTKYNIYIICKNEEIFENKKEELLSQHKSKICHIQWIPAEYLKLTQCNKRILKDLNTRYNTQKKKVLAKLGCIAAHRKALLAIYMNKTNNNIILEEDSNLSNGLPSPPLQSCYMGGWIVPPQTSNAGKIIPKMSPNYGLNEINLKKFKILMTHALFIKTFKEAMDLFQTTINDKLKNYDIHLSDQEFLKKFYYPPIFVQGSHVSDIEGVVNQNDKNSFNYGLNPKKKKSQSNRKTKSKKKSKKKKS